MPIASSSGSAIAKPITVPSTAWNALAPVSGALVRTTLRVANNTQKPFSTSSTPPSSRASASPTASRRLFWNATERVLSCRGHDRDEAVQHALHATVESLAHRADAGREAVGAGHDAGVGDDAADRGRNLAGEHRAVGTDRERVAGS